MAAWRTLLDEGLDEAVQTRADIQNGLQTFAAQHSVSAALQNSKARLWARLATAARAFAGTPP